MREPKISPSLDEDPDQFGLLFSDKDIDDYDTSVSFDNDNIEIKKELIEKQNKPNLAQVDKTSPTAVGTASKRKMSIPRKIPPEVVPNPGLKHKCDFCSSQFSYIRGLLKHEHDKHSDEMKFECDICSQRFMRAYNLERHKLCAHTTGKSKLLRHKKGMSAWRERKKRVRKTDKTQEDSYACDICGQLVPESRAETHVRIHTGERPFICHICGKGLISDKKLKRHLLIHSEAKRHVCKECGEGFAMKYKLRTHMFVHTGHKPYLCSVCGAEFYNSTSLLHHHRTLHLGDKRFECTICGGRYGKKSQLDEHMFSHSSERTQTCRFCGKSFKHAKSLRRHEATHVSDQKFSCDQCDHKFSRKDNLERHRLTHLQATLKCRFCKKKATDRKLLMEHEQFHINQRKFTCKICKERFQNEKYFNNHMEKVHEMTGKMIEMLNNTEEIQEDGQVDMSDKDLLAHNIVMETSGTRLDPSEAITITQDTLNYSMNVAGILPASTQDLIPTTSASLQQSVSVVQNPSLTSTQNIVITNGTRTILNQPATVSLAASVPILAGLNQNEEQRTLLLSTSNNLSVDEQRKIVQAAMETPTFRMQNMF